MKRTCILLAAVAIPLGMLGTLAHAAAWPRLDKPPPPEGGGGNDSAVVVGIEDYRDLADVPGAAANAKAWVDWLQDTRGVPAIKSLENGDATRATIMAAVKDASTKVKPGGTLWFVFVGHGATAPEDRIAGLPADGVLVDAVAQQRVSDFYPNTIRRQELLDALEPVDGARTVVVLDACFSGKAADGELLIKDLQPVVLAGSWSPDRATVLTATSEGQFAGPLPGAARPAFSYLVLGALRGWGDADSDGRITAQEALDYASNTLFEKVKDRQQTPMLLGTGGAEVLATPRTPEPPPEGGNSQFEPRQGYSYEQILIGDEVYYMARIAPGSFTMGSPEGEEGRRRDEIEHRVEISRSFRIGATEVTQAFYEAVMGEDPVGTRQRDTPEGREPCSEWGHGDELPVFCVGWLDAVRFCNELSRLQGLEAAYTIRGTEVSWNTLADGYRLPTEAEWEYAARAGSRTPYPGAKGAGDVCEHGNVVDEPTREVYGWIRFQPFGCDDGFAGLAPAGQLEPNAWGLHDMTGNLYEWLWDAYAPYPDGGIADPVGPLGDQPRVIRGGSWHSTPAHTRVACRSAQPPTAIDRNLGFRIAQGGR